MKNFIFESILILSHKEKRARILRFHPRRNLIVGMNHTGKSTLIKTIYRTLGATPAGKLEDWDDAAISLVNFNFNETSYSLLYQLGNYALFKQNTLLYATSNYSEWTQEFAQKLGFNLLVTNKERQTISASPACFFLPFYIDQDGSWQATWDTFPSTKGLSKPVKAILEYFSGIKPPEWYKLEADKKSTQQELEDYRREHSFLMKAKERITKTMPISGPKLEPENFLEEIRQLVKEVSNLNEKQEKLRDKVVREKETVCNAKLQLNIASSALDTYEKDNRYLSADRETLICPTCHAEHSEQFLELFSYAEEARVLYTLHTLLSRDLERAEIELKKSKNAQHDIAANYARISEILSVRRGELEFRQVVEGRSAEHALRIFSEEENELQELIDDKTNTLLKLQQKLKDLTDRKRSKVIMDSFRSMYEASLQHLNLPAQHNVKKMQLTSRPNVSGSGGPRLILAYYNALWHICTSSHGDFSVPLVIDSPNQKGQDEINLPKILEFVATKIPQSSQIILGSEIDTEYEFDNKITLTAERQLLNKEEFGEALSIIEPLASLMNQEIWAKNNKTE